MKSICWDLSTFAILGSQVFHALVDGRRSIVVCGGGINFIIESGSSGILLGLLLFLLLSGLSGVFCDNLD